MLSISNAQGYQLCFCVLEESGFFCLVFFLTIDPKIILIKPLQAYRMTLTNISAEKYPPGSGVANFTFSADLHCLLSEPYINAGSVL